MASASTARAISWTCALARTSGRHETSRPSSCSGSQHGRTPDGARLDLYRQSGHAQLYAEYMYPPMRFEDGEELELRPVNCPHHIVVYQTELRSYRELPLRIAEIGNNWRYERSG